MKTVEILGTGCARCKKLYQAVADVIAAELLDIELKKIEDINAIVAAGVMNTPAMRVDGQIVSAGRDLSRDEIIKLLKG